MAVTLRPYFPDFHGLINVNFNTCKMLSIVIHPLHPTISMHILHTVLYTFPRLLRRRICLPIRSLSSW